jgi:type IV pilus assembly protein PilQ
MNSLNFSIKKVRSAMLLIAMAALLTISVAAQQIAPQKQGRHYGEPDFRGEAISLDVVNADVRDILRYITDQYGINFVLDRSVKDVPVTVKVMDVPWNIALDSILQAQELGVQVNGNILRVADNKTLAAEGELFRERMNNQLDTSPLYTEFVRLNYARASGTLANDAGGAGQTVTGTSGGESAGGGGGGGSDQGILGIIKKRLSRRGTVEVDGRSNTLIITDVSKNIDAIKQLISLLDQPEPQVEIEARIVVASRNFSRDVGIQIAALVLGGRGSAAGGGTLPNAESALTPPAGYPVPSINNDMFSKIANTAIGLTTGVFGTAQINAMISAGEQRGQAKVIATPRVTTLNNRSAEIKSGTKIPVTTIQPGGGAGGAIVATTTYVDVPLRLAITPQITGEDTVILNVVAENSSTATLVGGVAPAINTQSMTTQVTVPDGGTTVIGGVLFDDERESQDRTPGLASIPVFGNLFKRKGIQRNTNEILFFITPRITRADHSMNGGGGARPTTIIQPVPMGNPPSNSSPAQEASPVVLQAPVTARPEVVQTAPNKP